jgi:hypothetical protein
VVQGNLYFITEQYFIDFPDPYLMKNKEMVNGVLHDRPSYYAFSDGNEPEIYWMIPFSSKYSKYKGIYDKKVKRYKKCDTLVFGKVMGEDKAFLIQNMCPVVQSYINNEYLDINTGSPVTLSKALTSELDGKSRKVLNLYHRGYHKLIFPNIGYIEQSLIKQIHK